MQIIVEDRMGAAFTTHTESDDVSIEIKDYGSTMVIHIDKKEQN